MTTEWLYSDNTDQTLAHVSKIELNNKKAVFPQHALTHSDYDVFTELNQEDKIQKDGMIIVGEPLNQNTLDGVGHEAMVTNALFSRLKGKLIRGKLNLVYPRIPNAVKQGNTIIEVDRIDDLQASALVGVQLELDANGIIVPVPNNIKEKKAFDRIFERTINERKTFNADKEIIGLIPKTNAIDLIPLIIKDYVKEGVRHFAMDFSASTIPRAHLRTAVRAIRETLRIKKGNISEEKQYTLHALNVSFAVKSQSEVSPITDLLTHVYGVDSTSGVIWGGGKLDKEKLRYYNTADYGAYRINSLQNNSISVPESLINGNPVEVYKKLRTNRIVAYQNECARISSKVAEQNAALGYSAYINTKNRATEIVNKALSDIKEIRAS